MRAAFVERGKCGVLAGAFLAARRLDRLKPGQAISDVVLEARLRLLAVADDVDADVELLFYDLGDSFDRLARQRSRIVRLLEHARQQSAESECRRGRLPTPVVRMRRRLSSMTLMCFPRWFFLCCDGGGSCRLVCALQPTPERMRVALFG